LLRFKICGVPFALSTVVTCVCAHCLQLPCSFQIIQKMIDTFQFLGGRELWTFCSITLVQTGIGTVSVLEIAWSVGVKTSTQRLSLICPCPYFPLTNTHTHTHTHKRVWLLLVHMSCHFVLVFSALCSHVLLLSAMGHRVALAFHMYLSLVALVCFEAC
jgi:hypothetical protein